MGLRWDDLVIEKAGDSPPRSLPPHTGREGKPFRLAQRET